MRERSQNFAIVGALALMACLFGIATRHAGLISAFWPVNAMLLALMVRMPRMHCVAGWVGALIGYIAADMLFGRDFSASFPLACANIVSVLTATLLLNRLDPADLQLRRPHSVLRILACLIPASFAAAAYAAAVIAPLVLHGPPFEALMFWTAGELVNYLTVLPVMLTIPLRSQKHHRLDVEEVSSGNVALWPALLLLLSCVAAVIIGGPGAIMFPMPALLWCALTYTVPLTAILTMFMGAGIMMAAGFGLIDLGYDMEIYESFVSLRVSVTFMLLVPLTISSAMAARDDLLIQLRHSANHDGLTGLLNRMAFDAAVPVRLDAARAGRRRLALILLDIDRFKVINDTHGHPAGDAVLQGFAAVIRGCCWRDDLIARVGGEEFAVLADVTDLADTDALAERIRGNFERSGIIFEETEIRATVSIGACYLGRPPEDIATHIHRVDKALYRAKQNGRNRIEWAEA